MASTPRILHLSQRMTSLPAGRLLFAWAVCMRAPYFGTIRPRIKTLEPGHSVWKMRKRRAVQNHLGTVHALAVGNLCELAAGTLMEASLPVSHRWIPKGMHIHYLRKARTDLVGEATLPPQERERLGDIPVEVNVRDEANEVVVTAVIHMHVSERRDQSHA